MADDDLVSVLTLHQLDAALGDEAVRRAVEAVAAQVILRVILGGDCIAVGFGRHGHVERRVEDRDLGLAGHGLFTGFDAHKVGGVVQRAKGNAVADGLLAGVVDDAGGNKLVAAVQHAVTHSVDLVDGLDDAVLAVDQNVHDSLDSLFVRGHGDVLDQFLAGRDDLVVESAVKTDALAQTLGGDVAGIGVHELILQARAAGVDDQNVHNSIHSCI